MEGFVSWLGETLYSAVSFVFGLLDICPFKQILADVAASDSFSQGLGWLNWFMPIGKVMALFILWLTCLAVYYGIQIILRWVRAIH